MLPPGSTDNGLCGSVANSFQIALLPLRFLDVGEQLTGEDLLITAAFGDALPAEHIALEQASDGANFTPTAYTAVATAGNHYRFTLPAVTAGNYFRVQAIGDDGAVYSNVLPPLGDASSPRPGQPRIFPVPATNFVYVYTAPDEKVTSAAVINCMGQVLRSIPVPARTTVIRCELPSSLPAGIYFIRLTEMDRMPLTVPILKTP
jgi:hypothetical protein